MNARIKDLFSVLFVVFFGVALFPTMATSPLPQGGNCTITPPSLSLNIARGKEQTTRFRVTVPPGFAHPIDVFFVVDTSRSFTGELDCLRREVREIMAGFPPQTSGAIRFGLAEFSDYPIPPYGSAFARDVAYRRLVDLTTDRQRIFTALDRLATMDGGDTKESQFAALYQAATGAGQDLNGNGSFNDIGDIPPMQQANFRPDASKFIVLATDAPFHRAGDRDVGVQYPLDKSPNEVCRALNNNGRGITNIKVIGISASDGNFPPAQDRDVPYGQEVDPGLGQLFAVARPQAIADLVEVARCTNTFAPLGGVDCDGNGVFEPARGDLAAGQPFVCDLSPMCRGVGIANAIKSLCEVSLLPPIDNPPTPCDESKLVTKIVPVGFTSGMVDVQAGGTFDFDVTLTCPDTNACAGDQTFDLRAMVCNSECARASVKLTCRDCATNRPPVCTPPPPISIMARPHDPFTLTGSATDPDGPGDISRLQWRQTAGPTAREIGCGSMANNQLVCSYEAPEAPVGTMLTFQFTATDGCGATCTGQAVATVVIANAGPICQPPMTDPVGRVNPKQVVLLIGKAMDPNGLADIAKWEWRQMTGPTVQINCEAPNENALICSFIAPDVTAAPPQLCFEFTVTDKGGLTCVRQQCISVNRAPRCTVDSPAPACPKGGDTIRIRGTAMDPEGADEIFLVSWRQTAGPTVRLDCGMPQNNSLTCTFVAPAVPPAGTDFRFVFTVLDKGGLSTECPLTVGVGKDTVAPIIRCPADITVATGPAATTCATNVDPGRATATDECSPPVTVAGARSDMKPLTDPYPVGTTTITWTATDAAGNRATCQQRITVQDRTSPVCTITSPLQNGRVCATATAVDVTGTATDNCGVRSIELQAFQSGKQIGGVTCPMIANPFNCRVPVMGLNQDPLLIVAIVRDLSNNPGVCTVNLRVNRPPVATCGPNQTVPEGARVTLEGRGSDPDGDPLTFRWRLVSVSDPRFPVELTNPNTATPTFTAPLLRATDPPCLTYIFELVVNDGCDDSPPCRTQITVQNFLILRDNRNGNQLKINLCEEQQTVRYEFFAARINQTFTGTARISRGQGDGSQWHIFDVNNSIRLAANVDIRRLVATTVFVVGTDEFSIFDGNFESNRP